MDMMANTLQSSRVFIESVGMVCKTRMGCAFLIFVFGYKLAITNTFFQNNKSRLITFSSGGSHTQIDFILVRRAQLKNVKDTK